MNEFTEGWNSFLFLIPAYGRKMISSGYGYKAVDHARNFRLS